MEITTLTTDLNHHQAQDDNPNDSGGLTAAQYKVVCDQGVNDIKDYLNGTHIPQLDAEHLPYIYGGTQTIKTTMETLTAGVMPDASVTAAKASTNFLYGVIGALSAITPAAADKIPFSDTSGGVAGYSTVENMAHAFSAFGMASIETGTYTGDGTSGASNPNSLTFSNKCKLLIVYSQETPLIGLFPVFACTGSYLARTCAELGIYSDSARLSEYIYTKKSVGEKTVYWYYVSSSPASQFNATGVVYPYLALTRG